jgi:hypothetical protein
MRRMVGSAPGPLPGVLVVWSDGCVMSQQSRTMPRRQHPTSLLRRPTPSRRSGNKGYVAPGCRMAFLRRLGPRGCCGRNSVPTTPLSVPP